MRKVLYHVGLSLDGCIASADGSFEWLNRTTKEAEGTGEDFGMKELFARIDTVLMGRKTYELMLSFGQPGGYPNVKNVVFSKTLPSSQEKNVEIVREDAATYVAALKQGPGKDIYLCGGGALARDLLSHGLVDQIEMGVVPVLVGGGIPCFPAGFPETDLKLLHSKQCAGGVMVLSYEVVKAGKAQPKATKSAAGKAKSKS